MAEYGPYDGNRRRFYVVPIHVEGDEMYVYSASLDMADLQNVWSIKDLRISAPFVSCIVIAFPTA